ncbi:MAG: hypothetical protein NVSMB66_4140 [Candidatus Doudnabacteria bacterium]
MSERITYQSSLIRSTLYNHDRHELEVVLVSGDVRIYKDVPSEKVRELEERRGGTPSAGAYFEENIDNIYSRKENA